ncbi:MAG: aminotransferase class I/II-fold pyridoxal phosphate-dependent enzyme, partial [Sandaracinaceae bacterium]|nr:aminotransferase class I/II-fold pyridoxal phosphate-dependent enzyme [Sandaracinaceae bacterium]
GYYDLHRELEKNLSILKGAEDTIIYPSGYATNVGIISCFLGPKDTIILDKLAHASIIDGALLSGAKITTFRHNDMDSLERVLIQTKKGQGDRLVVVEGVYSMDGDIAPLRDIYELVKKHGAKLMVDEAHATGVLGKTGKGSPEHFGLEGKIDLVMGTFSKSLGGLGGFVSAKKEVVCYLRYFSRAYFFAASPTPVQVAAQNAAVQVLMTEPQW